MAQVRKLIFGSLIDTEDTPVVISNLFSPGRLKGFDFEVAGSDLLRITSGSCLLPDGVVILESDKRSLVIEHSSFSTEYTIVYQLEDTRVLGGSPAVLRLLPGLSKQSSFTDATILGWVKYPGGSVPINDSMFVQPESIRITQTLASLYKIFSSPFTDAIRSEVELAKDKIMQTVRVANLGQNFNSLMSFGGSSARILSAGILSETANYPLDTLTNNSYTIKKAFNITGNTSIGSSSVAVSDASRLITGQIIKGAGIANPSYISTIAGNLITINTLAQATANNVKITVSDTLFTLSNSTTNITSLETKPFLKNAISPSRFSLLETDFLFIENVATGAVASGQGSINVLAETPASRGVWEESTQIYAGEYARRFLNLGNTVETYNFKLPFTITGEGQPRKLVTRLIVDFNAIVTIKIIIDGQNLILDPSSGTISNTGALVTREFNIPLTTSVNWTPGKTATISVDIQGQPGGSASFSHISLTVDSSPFLLFN